MEFTMRPIKSRFKWDVFICHASEDKTDVATPLANELAGHSLRVGIDETESRPGAGLHATNDEGLSRSRFVIIIFSAHSLHKPWTQAELGALCQGVARVLRADSCMP